MSDRTFKSVVDMFHHTVESRPDAEAMIGRRGGVWYSQSWRETADQVRRVACGLLSLGLEKS